MKVRRVLIWGVCCILVSCSDLTNIDYSDAEQHDAAVDGKTISYSPGREFKVTLDSWADAGFSWDCLISDTLVVAMSGQPRYRPKEEGEIKCGGLSLATFTFLTKEPGLSQVRLIEHQRWMTDVPPRLTIVFNVSVGR